jgi:DNA-binding transcriptional MocR family regulator
LALFQSVKWRYIHHTNPIGGTKCAFHSIVKVQHPFTSRSKCTCDRESFAFDRRQFACPPGQLAQDLGVNRITVENAYAELEAEGLVFSKLGSGTYVLSPDSLPLISKNSLGAPWPLWQQSIQDKTNSNKLPVEIKPNRYPHPVSLPAARRCQLFPAEDFRRCQTVHALQDGLPIDYGE